MSLAELCDDLSADLVEYYDPDVASLIKEPPSRPANLLADLQWRQSQSRSPLLDSDDPNVVQGVPLISHNPTPEGPEIENAEKNLQAMRDERLFPNSFKITGLKHVCDNLTGAVLQALPQFLGLVTS